MNHTPTTVIELRRYLMNPGRRDDLVALFEREFIETQEAAGLQVLGIFTEPHEPDRFTWLRGFADMATRAAGLQAFYGGPVWQAHRETANATMADSDDVLLLRPSPGLPGLAAAARPAAPRPWRAVVLPLAEPAHTALRHVVATQWLPALERAGAESVAVFETEPAENNFPRLPVRSDGPVLVVTAAWPSGLPVPGLADLAPWMRAAPQVLELSPTARSPRA
ncbi:MAG: NIPSNAP family protein [Pseudomonadota bacterium]